MTARMGRRTKPLLAGRRSGLSGLCTLPVAWCWAGLAGVVLLTACAAAPPPRSDVRWERYQGLLVPAPLLPFEAGGSAMIHYRGERESGGIQLEGTPQGDFTLRLSTRVLGTTALEIRFNPDTLLILDYGAETYWLGPNSPANRQRVFALDMTPAEMLMAVTGRVPEPVFRKGRGELVAGERAVFSTGDATYRFQLGPDGLPRAWDKHIAGETRFRVKYREYMDVETGGAPLRVPRKIRVFTGDGTLLAVLGIGRFRPWRENTAQVAFRVDPGDGLRYQPLEE